MVKKKSDLENEKNWMHDLFDDIQARKGEKIRSRWYVVEITPSEKYYRGNGHGGSEVDWTDRKEIMVSEYFATKKTAQKFIDEHVPDKGKTLEIRIESLYRRTVEEWFHGD